MPQVHALLVDGVRSQPTSDGHAGILHFQRARPDSHGSREMNIAVPLPLLPYVAAAALEVLPKSDQAASGSAPYALAVRSVQAGLAADGAMVLTVELDMGARLSFSIGEGQAASLQQTVSIAVGRQKAQAMRAVAAARSSHKR